MNRIQLERLMSENPDRVNRQDDGEVAQGPTQRPMPEFGKSPKALERLVAESRRRSPSKITKRKWVAE